ncbi:hypothetical protein [uncultured Sulfitobacter sp.]|uniref:hypothetical protein n=1 Tax=uncultured Sulfitobacter sp. TaxID=191468 RepID=UPI002606BE17|nr:hypothetical protein [uncultured Sulfitobacter sp.]
MKIRRAALAAALLCSTILTPAPVAAAPLAGFFAGFLTTALPGVSIAAGAGAAYAAGAATAAFFTTSLGSLVLSVGFALVQTALTPQPQSTDPGDRIVNYAKPISYFERVYGKVRNGGVMGCTTFRDDRRHYSVIVASHSINGFVEHYFDDDLVEINENGDVTTEPFDDYGSIRPYTGRPGQAADPVLVAGLPEWTAAHDMEGFAYAALFAKRTSAKKFSDVYTKGDIWTYAPVIEGHDQIWDPRDETHKYTDNAALIIAHEVVHTLGGEVDWDDVAIEADVSDQLVTNAEGGTQRRWTINALFSDDQDWDQVKTILLTACDGFMFERPDGKVGFYVGRWQEPEVILRDADFLSLQVTEGLDIGANTQYVAQYVEPGNLYRKTPTGAFIADATSKRKTREIPTFGVDNYDQAVRIAVRTAAVERAQFGVAGRLKLSGKYLMGQRFARIEHEELGLSLVVELSKLVIGEDRMSYGFQAISTTQADHEFNAATQSPSRPQYETLASDNAVPLVGSLSGSIAGSSGGSASIEFQWPMQDESFRQEIRIRSVDAGVPEWKIYAAGEGQTTFLATGLMDGALYEAQVRNKTSAGRVSLSWSPEAPISVRAVANSAAPTALRRFAAKRTGPDIDLEIMAPNDPNYYATQIFRADYPEDYTGAISEDDAEIVRVEYGLPGKEDLWTDANVPAGVHSYWGLPVNSSGVGGDLSEPSSTGLPALALIGVALTGGYGRIDAAGSAQDDPNLAGIELLSSETSDFATATVVGTLRAVAPNGEFEIGWGAVDAVSQIADPGFDDAAAWTIEHPGFTIQNSAAEHAGVGGVAVLKQAITLVEGITYRAGMQIVDKPVVSSSGVRLRIDGETDVDPLNPDVPSNDGVYWGEFVAPAGAHHLRLQSSNNFNGKLSQVWLIDKPAGSLEIGQRYYWLRPISNEGKAGPLSGPHLKLVK